MENRSLLGAMTGGDLLTISGGHNTEPSAVGGAPSVKQFLAFPVAHKPVTYFQYNGMGSYTLSAIVTKVTGQTVGEYLKPRLFEPLGIEHNNWPSSPEDVSLGAHGLYLLTEDIARFGQLYLRKGQWNGKQLIPEKWVEEEKKSDTILHLSVILLERSQKNSHFLKMSL